MRVALRAVLSLGLACTLACGGDAPPPTGTGVTTASVAGMWTSTLAYSGVSYPFSLTLAQSRDVVSGMGIIRDDEGTHVMGVSNSGVVGNKVTLVVDYTSGAGAAVRMTITGSVTSSTTIVGVVNLVQPQPAPAKIAITLTKTG